MYPTMSLHTNFNPFRNKVVDIKIPRNLDLTKLPRDWGNLFVIPRVRSIENPEITNLWENNQSVRYTGV